MTAPEPLAPRERRLLRAEIAVVLTVTFAWSGLYSLVRLIGYQLGPGVRDTTVTLNPVRSPHAVVDFLLQCLGAVQLFGWAALALYLLARSGIGFADIGFALRRPRREVLRDIGLGTGLAALIGLPGLALYLVGRALGMTANLVPASGDTQWWRILAYILLAAGNAVAEEVVVVGYFMTRLQRLGVGRVGRVASSAVLRGSYHLYQGFGAGLGNLVMGVVFGAAYERWRRLWPLVIAHFLIDVVAFVGYALLRPHLGWLG
ncbi:CPBP family intramembrane glutamic endopeptidase [Tsukamurella sp. PLM1]|uniref:CPBP family intramembrane glutamic endopeptidase n=1 Tax=Tsukamurella sp. PLM1 TaxID=2929795 RepID=UPI00205D8AB7|nr:CPBP family intramembrane glutamic endopeptidase [Tsukamurella sp. PLM1]BDH55191.1 CAAX amino protease [Tsukamurella sp. PLM1]